MCATFNPRRVATSAWPSSWSVLATTRAAAKLSSPSKEKDSTTSWVKVSHWCVTSTMPARLRSSTSIAT